MTHGVKILKYELTTASNSDDIASEFVLNSVILLKEKKLSVRAGVVLGLLYSTCWPRLSSKATFPVPSMIALSVRNFRLGHHLWEQEKLRCIRSLWLLRRFHGVKKADHVERSQGLKG